MHWSCRCCTQARDHLRLVSGKTIESVAGLEAIIAGMTAAREAGVDTIAGMTAAREAGVHTADIAAAQAKHDAGDAKLQALLPSSAN